jgi:hypothetical protein
MSMFSLRSKPALARIASATTLLLVGCVLLAAIPGLSAAAPEGDEGPPAPAPQLSFEPGSYDFGLQEANRSNAQAWFTLRNTGSTPAPVYYTEISGSGSNAFGTGYNDCGGRTLNPGDTCSVQVSFGPYDAVPFEAELRAYSEEGTVFSAGLSGEGGRAAFVPASDPTNFGSVPVGSAGVTKTIDITNRGNMAGGVFIAVIAGGAVGSFHLLDENCSGTMLSPAATCNLVVSFQPLSTGAKTARLGLFGDSDGGTQLILSGVGTDPELASDRDAPASQGAVSAAGDVKRAHRGRNRHRRSGAMQRRLRRATVAYRSTAR